MKVIQENSIHKIDSTMWDSISSSPFQTHNWMTFGEECMIKAGSKSTFIMILEDGKVISKAALWSIPNEPLPVSQPALKPLQNYFNKHPMIIIRSPISFMPGIAFSKEMQESDQQKLLKLLIKISREFKRKNNGSLVMFDSLPKQNKSIWPLPVYHYRFSFPGTVLNLQGVKSFDQYLEKCVSPSKKRNEIKRDLKIIKEQGISVSRHYTIPDIDAALKLYRRFESEKGTEYNPWTRFVFENINSVEGTTGTWIAAHLNGKLVAASLALTNGGNQVGVYMALDKTVRYAYFSLLYEGIKLAIEQGLDYLYWGAGAYEVKRRLGFSTFDNHFGVVTL